MQIHVVEKGDSLYNLAKMYSVPAEAIANANEIQDPNKLVIGEALVIPIWGSYYFVEKGDTLESISEKTGASVREIVNVNNLDDTKPLEEGTRLYIPQQARVQAYTASYIDPDITGDQSGEYVEAVGEQLTATNLFDYQFTREGELIPPKFEDEIIKSAVANGSIPTMVLTNIEEDMFSQDLAENLFNDSALQQQLIKDVVDIMNTKGYKSILLDFEYLGKDLKDGYNQFALNMKNAIAPYGHTIGVALAPKISDDQKGTLYEGHNYEFMGENMDAVDLMTYEWGWVYGPPMAVAPLNEVEKVVNYALDKVPADKIMMGIPLYGYDFTLPYVEGESRASTISNLDAVELAKDKNVEIKYDEEAQSPYFYYIDEEGKKHIVWFEDARSIQAKFDLVKEKDLKGFFYWVLGRDFPQNWLLIDDNFVVV